MTPVLFGKLPGHGDFVSRGLANATVERLDAALSAGLDATRAALGDDFERVHGLAPPWRFVARGEAGWRAGALAASADAAGRRYVVLVGLDGLDGAIAGALGANIAEHLEAVLYAAFAEELAADEVLRRAGEVARLVELAAPAAALMAAEPSASVWWTLGGAIHHADAASAETPDPALFVRMLTPAGAAPAQEEAA